jgi:hypothetical protein
MKRLLKLLTALAVFVLTFTWLAPPKIILAASQSADSALMGLGMSPQLASYITSTMVTLNASGNIVIPVATSQKLSVTVAGTEQGSLNATALTLPTDNLVLTAGDITVTAGKINIGTAASRLVPGATSMSLRNNANTQDNFICTDAGACTARTGLTSTASGITATAGDITASSGNLSISGTSTLTGAVTLPAGILNPTANEEAVAGAGTTVTDAAALSATKHIHQITGANGTVGWKFASATTGQVEILLNTTAGAPKIYAVAGGTCNGGAADAACTPLTGIRPIICWASAANAWICA